MIGVELLDSYAIAVSVDDGRGQSHWLEFADTWLATDAETLGQAIADRASGPR